MTLHAGLALVVLRVHAACAGAVPQCVASPLDRPGRPRATVPSPSPSVRPPAAPPATGGSRTRILVRTPACFGAILMGNAGKGDKMRWMHSVIQYIHSVVNHEHGMRGQSWLAGSVTSWAPHTVAQARNDFDLPPSFYYYYYARCKLITTPNWAVARSCKRGGPPLARSSSHEPRSEDRAPHRDQPRAPQEQRKKECQKPLRCAPGSGSSSLARPVTV